VSSLSPEVRQKIDRAKEILVKGAETLLTEARVIPDDRTFGHSQLRNLVAVATETESPSVVLNFIRYQMGRDDKNRGWAKRQDEKRLGDRFIDALQGEGGPVQKSLAGIAEIKEGTLTEQLARMELIRYFLGFATRYLKYLEIEARAQRGRQP
jgi:hypothetical protein